MNVLLKDSATAGAMEITPHRVMIMLIILIRVIYRVQTTYKLAFTGQIV